MEGKSEQMKTLSDISIEVRDLIAKISKLLDKNERNAIRSHGVQGLTPPQLFLLRQLWFQEENQGYSCNRLADISHVSRATITGIIDTMEKDGTIVYRKNPVK